MTNSFPPTARKLVDPIKTTTCTYAAGTGSTSAWRGQSLACALIMPTNFDVSRLAKARARLLSHPALESAPPDAPRVCTDTRLLRALCAQLADRPAILHGLDPVALSDRAAIAAVTHTPSLSDERWCLSLAKGASDGAPLADRALLRAVARAPQTNVCFSPSTRAVDDALVAASAAHRALARARKHARESTRLVEAAASAAAARRAATALPPAWENLGPRAENPIAKPLPGRRRRRRGPDAVSRCAFCPDLRHFGGLELDSELLGPFVNPRGRAALHVHFDCGCWAPQVFADSRTSQFRGVYDEYRRGRQLRCSGCTGKGATVGCYVEKCKRTFHYRCLDGAGARKVTEYFAAFCSSHAHLADKELYQLMMRASTIADVATARRESTDGLDAPHSKFTQLRRRDTEIIFSRVLKVTTHSGVYDSAKTLFSSARRAVLSKSDRLQLKDRVRLVRHSAIDVASGYLALRTAGNPKQGLDEDDICPTVARAAIASRHNSRLMLLRNLERAPCWTPDEISIAKPARKRSAHFNQRMRNYDGKSAPDSGAGNDALSDEEPVVNAAETEDDASRKRKADEMNDAKVDTRSGKSRRLGSLAGKTPAARPQQSVQLPSSMNDRLSASLRRTAETGLKMITLPDSAPPSPTPVKPKGRSGWDVFLAEQLPRERTVRPEDDTKEAMGNMARMWSLLPAAERAEYEIRAATSKPATVDGEIPQNSVQSPRALGVPPRRNVVAAGLFGVKPQSDVSGEDTQNRGKAAKTVKQSSGPDTNRATSFALSSQRRKWRTSRRAGATTPDESAPPNWDDIFPADLSCALPSAPGSAPSIDNVEHSSPTVSHVLPPPSSRKR